MKNLTYFAFLALLAVCCGKTGGFKTIATDDKSAWNIAGEAAISPQTLVLKGNEARAATTSLYKNFVLEFECKTSQGAIGALQFHSDGIKDNPKGYEILINNNAEPTEWRKSGSLSAVRNFGKCLAYNDTWVPFRIEVADKNIKAYIDGAFVVDYTEPAQPYRLPAYARRVLSEGVLVFANYSAAPIEFRNIRVKTLSPNLTNNKGAQDEQNDDIIRLSQQNFPTIDQHLHLKGGLTSQDVEALTRQYGITYGIAPNCGKNFPVTTDHDIDQWLDTNRHHLYLLPMQAEGREWLEMFSPAAVQKFDYVFTDALTWTDDKGRRMRIWIPEETFVDNQQHFMDLLVKRAVGIISTEPINIYVNPAFLPDQLLPQYDALWTKWRMTQVIDACVKAGVAIEINCRYKIPSQGFIQLAKEKGAKFTIGTNNAGKEDVGKLEYAVEIIKACGLTAADMWIPTSKNR
ncbi:hypothetical protein AGMMS4956_16590 [Bacteroidia bacterium]|nr:hypothetical protein AGMMS4956_16590 [Bacteroidia bacterium]